jgi:hypothetical protein
LDEVTADSDLLSEPDQIVTRPIKIANVSEYQFLRLQQIVETGRVGMSLPVKGGKSMEFSSNHFDKKSNYIGDRISFETI